MELTIEQSCPSCGASIELREEDRLVLCEFCGVHNYKCGDTAGRYVLPYRLPDQISPDEVFFAPYLRFKGAVYYIRGADVKHKLVDTTRAGFGATVSGCFPVSLGLRPQALRLQPVVAGTEGIFLQQSVPTREVFIHAVGVLDIFGEKDAKDTYHRAFIGETLSRIYQPYYIHNDCYYDAVLRKKVGVVSEIKQLLQDTIFSTKAWEPDFISTFCPFCGGRLQGEADSIVLQCKNCRRHWKEEGGRFQEVKWSVGYSGLSTSQYLPFWKIRCTIEGYSLTSYGDLLRFTNQPVVLSRAYDTMPLIFYIPAFKLQPKSFLQVSAQLTRTQPRLPIEKDDAAIKGYPVTLNQDEAVQAIKSVMASITVSRKTRFPLLPSLQVRPAETVLTYLPFEQKSHDFIQPESLASLQTAALKVGRSL